MTLVAYKESLGDDRFSHEQIAATITQKVQQLIVLPTEKCNFRCTYCYEDFQIGKMKDAVQASVERFMDRRIPELSEFSIMWFGGEPLVAKAVVLRLSSYAHRLCERHGVSFHGSLTTNAYLLEHGLFQELVSYGQRYFQITLDGWGEGHDAVRRFANGRGTFDRIWSNLVSIKNVSEDFTIQLRIHVRRDNYDSLKMLLRKLAEEFGGDARFTLDFEHLRNLGGEGGKTVERPLSLSELRAIEAELRLEFASTIAKLHRLPLPAQQQSEASGFSAPGENSASDSRPHAEPYICYAAKPNSLLIRADGRIGKCTVALNDDRNTIGTINPDGTVAIDNHLLRPWIRGVSTLDPDALACPLEGLHQFGAAARIG